MTNEREQTPQSTSGQQEAAAKTEQQHTVEDLEIRAEDLDKVKGGSIGDPCEGGQVTRLR